MKSLTRRIRFAGILGVAAAVLLCPAADAHRAKGSLTTLDYNPASGLLEVVHRLHRHDAELGIGDIVNDPSLSLDDLRAQARVALYVEQHFSIKANDEALEFKLVGAELAGDYLLVYQERAGPLPQRIAVRDDILRDAFATQINQVNIRDGDTIHTLIFTGDDTWHRFTFGNATDSGGTG